MSKVIDDIIAREESGQPCITPLPMPCKRLMLEVEAHYLQQRAQEDTAISATIDNVDTLRAKVAALEAEKARGFVPEGFVLVPDEPTPEMLEVGDGYQGTPATYRAMIRNAPKACIETEFSQFLSAVMDAAGLVRHGRQSKELSDYLGGMCIKYRTADPQPSPAPAAPDVAGLVEALRQYRHNDGSDGFVFGYDKEMTDRYVAGLAQGGAADLERIRHLVDLATAAHFREMESRTAGLVEALEEIVSPVTFMKKRLKSDEKLEGFYAQQLSSDPNYLKQIAARALAAHRQQEG